MKKAAFLLPCACVVFSGGAAFAGDPVNEKQAREIALALEPGKVYETDIKKFTSRTLYEYEIKKEDGTIMEVVVDGNTGEVIEHKIDRLGPNTKLPEPKISEDEAKEIAKAHVDEIFKRGKGAVVKEIKYTLSDGKPAYEVDAVKLFREFEVYVDAMTGEVMSAEEDD